MVKCKRKTDVKYIHKSNTVIGKVNFVRQATLWRMIATSPALLVYLNESARPVKLLKQLYGRKRYTYLRLPPVLAV